MKNITEDEFYDLFKPQINHILRVKTSKEIKDEDITSFGGCMYETYDEELVYVLSLADKKRVVTILDTDGDLYLVSGYHFINRLGYLILEKPFEFEFEVKLD